MYTPFPSQLLEKAVGEFSKLPGIGRKTALRLVLDLLRRSDDEVDAFASAISTMKHEVNKSMICVVENIQDVMAIENTQQYSGLYHVLGGIISPMDGIGPSDIEIDSLVGRVADGGVEEVIMAISPTMEGDTTSFYISRRLAAFDVKISVIARGIAVGDELEYADEVTLGRSILNRTPLYK